MVNKNVENEKNQKPGWSRKTKMYLLVLVAGVGLIATGLVYKNGKVSSPTADNNDSKLEAGVDEKDETAKNYLEGILKNSDNLKLGNFKLMSSAGEIYLKTTRDFSKLVGLQVLVLINGTMEKFELIDIQSKVADDSYILPR